jgi:hypothetical protein
MCVGRKAIAACYKFNRKKCLQTLNNSTNIRSSTTQREQSKMSNDKLQNAARLVRQYTAGSCDVYALAGPAGAARRRHIMVELTGERGAPFGINAVRKALHEAAGITGTCAADADHKFAVWCASA